MSPIDLVILGMLSGKSMSAYSLAKAVRNEKLGEMVKISTPAVYKNVLRLHEKGLLTARLTRHGAMPEKTVYSVTDKGRKYFAELMERYSGEPFGIYFDFNSFVYCLKFISRERGLRLLGHLKNSVSEKQNTIEEAMRARQGGHPVDRGIVKQQYMLNITLIAWLEEFIEEYRSS